MNRLMAIAFVFATASAASAQDLKDILSKHQQAYEQELAKNDTGVRKALEALPEQYLQALKKLEQTFQQAGDLDGLLQTRKEIERFTASKQLPDEASAQPLKALSDIQRKFVERSRDMNLNRNRQVVALADRYLAVLESLKKSLTVQGKIEDALQVNAEINLVKKRAEITAAQFALADAGVAPAAQEPVPASPVPKEEPPSGSMPLAWSKGLVLWNTLDSAMSVKASRVGPGGELAGGSFGAGKFGGALSAGVGESDVVAFPGKVVNAQAGCIEFWAKLVDVPPALPWGQNPTLVRYMSGSDAHLILHLNGNDGGGRGGVCASIDGIGAAATGVYGNWTYAQALGTSDIAAWHHYALVWDSNGIAGVDNGKHKLAVFVDGVLNSRRWEEPGGPRPPPLPAGQLRLMFQQRMTQGRVLFDELKVWNRAKTDFTQGPRRKE